MKFTEFLDVFFSNVHNFLKCIKVHSIVDDYFINKVFLSPFYSKGISVMFDSRDIIVDFLTETSSLSSILFLSKDDYEYIKKYYINWKYHEIIDEYYEKGKDLVKFFEKRKIDRLGKLEEYKNLLHKYKELMKSIKVKINFLYKGILYTERPLVGISICIGNAKVKFVLQDDKFTYDIIVENKYFVLESEKKRKRKIKLLKQYLEDKPIRNKFVLEAINGLVNLIVFEVNYIRVVLETIVNKIPELLVKVV